MNASTHIRARTYVHPRKHLEPLTYSFTIFTRDGLCAGELGDLDKVKRIVKLVGFVNCSSGFTEQPKVINGCSDFLKQVSSSANKC